MEFKTYVEINYVTTKFQRAEESYEKGEWNYSAVRFLHYL
jgi:hypothetical protein